MRTPIKAPATHKKKDSAKTKSIISRSEKPTAFNAPNSGVLSRTAWLIVLPVSKRIVKKEAAKTELIIKPIFPICSANILLKASSVEVFVSSREFLKSSSISFAIDSAWSGFSILTI